ncbi:hypothetical protein B0H14DRAFT_2244275, partial [Mycena olivaceomarginata]
CPPGAPEWFVHAREQMTLTNLGPHFNAALAAWTRIEAACKFENPQHKLTHLKRPREITQWINGGRGRKQTPPTVDKPGRFEAEWWAWWDSLQPEWRVRGEDGNWMSGEFGGEGEWDDMLLHWGQNGTLSIIAGLYFWGCAVMDQPELLGRWEVAVNDVAWILE